MRNEPSVVSESDSVSAAWGWTREAGQVPARLAFVLVFPVFFLYQVLARSGVIAPVLGGYGTLGALLAFPLAAYGALRRIQSTGVAPSIGVSVLAAYLLLFTTVVVTADPGLVDAAISAPHSAYIFKFLVWFLVARAVDASSRRFQVLNQAFFWVCSVIAIATSTTETLLAAALQPAMIDGFETDYQGAALVYLVIVGYALPSMRRVARVLAYITAVVTLFFVGARSEFVALVLVIGVIEWCTARSRPLLFGIGLLLVFSALPLLSAIDAGLFPENRVLGLLRLADDQSAILRGEFLVQAWRTIDENPLLGAYGSYQAGEYAHNILSAWVDLGLLGFGLAVLMVSIPVLGLFGHYASDSRSPDYIQALAFAIAVAVLAVTAKAHTYQLVPFSIGLYAQYSARRRALHRATKVLNTELLVRDSRAVR